MTYIGSISYAEEINESKRDEDREHNREDGCYPTWKQLRDMLATSDDPFVDPGREKGREYEILNICKFNSIRKRMSRAVRGPDGPIKLCCKGTDTVILERLSKNQPYTERTLQHPEVRQLLSSACDCTYALLAGLRDRGSAHTLHHVA